MYTRGASHIVVYHIHTRNSEFKKIFIGFFLEIEMCFSPTLQEFVSFPSQLAKKYLKICL